MEPYPNIIYTPTEVDELSTLGTDIGAYIGQTRAKWVTQGGIDADWDGYVRQLEQMGLSRFVQIRTEAYKRYKAQ
jgi:putative aldouronate transport system substrate-binding protein